MSREKVSVGAEAMLFDGTEASARAMTAWIDEVHGVPRDGVTGDPLPRRPEYQPGYTHKAGRLTVEVAEEWIVRLPYGRGPSNVRAGETLFRILGQWVVSGGMVVDETVVREPFDG